MDGVDIEGDLHVLVRKEGKRFRLRVYNKQRTTAICASFSVESLDQLKTGRKADMLRKTIQDRYEEHKQALEQLIIIIEDHTSDHFHMIPQKDEETKDEGFSDERLERARKMVRDPGFMYQLGEVYDQGTMVPKIPKPRFVIGEERNKRLVPFTVASGGKKGTTRINRVLGGIATAKDSIARISNKLLRKTVKIVERTYMSAATQRYSDELRNCVLYIPDAPSMSGEAGRQLRFHRADDGGLLSEYVLRDKDTGEMTTKVAESVIDAIITTTSEVRFDRAAESGTITFHTRDEPALTRRVQQEQLLFWEGKRKVYDEEKFKDWQAAFYILFNEEVPDKMPLVPYASRLMPFFDHRMTTARRSVHKLCDIISLMAFIRRFQKLKQNRGTADLIDFYWALQLGWDIIGTTASEMSPREKTVFEAVKKNTHYVGNDAYQSTATVKEISEATKMPNKTCYGLAEKLVEKAAFSKDKEGGKNVYHILWNEADTNDDEDENIKTKRKSLLATLAIRDPTPKQLMSAIVGLFNDFSDFSLYLGGTYIVFNDPITGQEIELHADGTYKIDGVPPEEREKSKTDETDSEKQPNKESGIKTLMPEVTSSKIAFYYKRIKPGRPCSRCERRSAEYELYDTLEKTTHLRCTPCFNDLRTGGFKLEEVMIQ